MKLKMGDDIQDLQLFEKRESKRDRYRRTGERLERRSRDGRGRDGRDGRRGEGRDGRRSDSKDGRRSDGKDGRRSDGKKRDYKARDSKKRDTRGRNNKNMDKISQILDMNPSELPTFDEKSFEKQEHAKKNAEKQSSRKREGGSKGGRRKQAENPFENVGRINIKGEGTTKAWYVGQDEDTMNMSKAEKKSVKAQNKKRSLDYLQDMSDLVMESFGKRKNRENK
jgi:ATP-dependent RNA helicase DeaD